MKPRTAPQGKVTEYTTPAGSRRWRFVIDAPGAPGRRRQIKREGFTTRRAAREALAALRHNLYEGTVPIPDATSTEAFALSWLSALGAEGLESSTVLHYRDCMTRMLPYIGTIALQSLEASDLDAAYGELRDRGLSARSIRASHIATHKMLKDAKRLGKVRDVATTMARPPRARAAIAKTFHTWTLDELKRFLDASSSDSDAPIWWVMAFTGIRRGEVPGLCWSDVDLDAGVLHVRRAIGRGEKGAYSKATKSDSGNRSIELDSDTVKMLRDHRRAQAERRLLVGPGWRDRAGLVFTEVDGSPIELSRLTSRWRSLTRTHAAAAGVAVIRLHDLRHSHATQLLAAGARPEVVTKRLGHSSVAFTLSTYAHVYEGDQRAALKRMLGGPS
jgi:integrase